MAQEEASRGGHESDATDRLIAGADLRRATDAAAEPGRLRLDSLLAELMERAGEVLDTQGRLRSLLDAVVSIGEDLSLSAVLHRIVSAACELVEAEFGALGVLSRDRQGLSDFITVGLTPDEVAAIGHLPQGRGILGVLIEEPNPLCLHAIADHPASHGFPPGHPPMSTFLGVPVRTRSKIFGNLYLTEKRGGKDFTEEDEQLVVALAAAAGAAIQNAQLYDMQTRRQSWVSAASEVRGAALGGSPSDVLSTLIVSEARAAADAALVTLVLPSPQGLRVSASTAGELVGMVVDATSYVAAVTADRKPLLVEALNDSARSSVPDYLRDSVGSVIFAPLGRDESDQALGVLSVGYPLGVSDLESEMELIVGFAGQAGVALQLAEAQHDRERLVVLEDRDRIARDLHDLVIQRLFATGMTLQSTAPLIDNATAKARLSAVVDDLDATIRDLRQAIYELQTPTSDDDLRIEIQRLVDRATAGSTATVRVHFAGLVGSLVPEALRPHLLAVLQESVSNAVRHASAATVDVSISVDESITVTVDDDGVGIDPTVTRRSGLANLSARAAELGGTCEIGAGDRGVGTRIAWTVPIGDA